MKTELNQPTAQIQNKKMLVISVLLFFVMVAFSLWAGWQLPDDVRLPVHWNLQGEVDRYGGKWEGLLTWPVVFLFLSLFLAFVPRFDPLGENLLRSAKVLKILWVAGLLFFAGVQIGTVLYALGYNINWTLLVMTAICVLFIVIGNYLGKLRRNYFVGVRTPWTVASDLVWDKTHRLAGKLFVATGVISLVAHFLLAPTVAFMLMIVCLVVCVFGSVGYSYWIWKTERQTQEIQL